MKSIPGPSPRGRGNRGAAGTAAFRLGSIPAWAGKPPTRGVRGSSITVHPRVGGETQERSIAGHHPRGPSPRGRGNRLYCSCVVPSCGSIPAWAGKPPPPPSPDDYQGVHPRVGGETLRSRRVVQLEDGPSPRGRGNLQDQRLADVLFRSIPAWAGKPAGGGHAAGTPWVHPRVGGETSCGRKRGTSNSGPSPRGRGNRRGGSLAGARWRSIPAWAGKPHPVAPPLRRQEVHPRVGGETAQGLGESCKSAGPSPRGRGNPIPGGTAEAEFRSIPAWAGKPGRPSHR